MNLRLILLLLVFSVSFHSFSQKRIKWVIVQGKVTDTFGYAMPKEKIALISKNGNDKSIHITDEFGRFSFMVKKKKLKDYAVRCYHSWVGNNPTVSLQEFVKHSEYVVKTNAYYAHHKQYTFFGKAEFYIYECGATPGIRVGTLLKTKDVYWGSPGDLNEYIRSHFGMVR